uniref:Blue sensitive cone opsin n=1 Tax=Gallus gallus TaxID=9031 RepID=A0A8V0X3M3_CHICK
MHPPRPTTDLPEDFYIPMALDAPNITALSPFLVPQTHLGSPGLFRAMAAFMFLLIALGVPINTLTIFCTARFRKLRSHLNYILVNLALANLLVILVGSTTACYSFSQMYFALGPTACKIEGFAATLGGMVSLWSLAVVAFERFLVICKPLGNFTFRGSHAVLGCVATWVLGFVASAPPLFGWSRYIPEGLQCSCGPDWYTTDNKWHNESYVLFLFTFCFGVPLAIIVFSYGRLLITLRAVARQQSCPPAAMFPPGPAGGPAAILSCAHHVAPLSRRWPGNHLVLRWPGSHLAPRQPSCPVPTMLSPCLAGGPAAILPPRPPSCSLVLQVAWQPSCPPPASILPPCPAGGPAAILSLGGPEAILPPRQPSCPPGSHVSPWSRRLPGSHLVLRWPGSHLVLWLPSCPPGSHVSPCSRRLPGSHLVLRWPGSHLAPPAAMFAPAPAGCPAAILSFGRHVAPPAAMFAPGPAGCPAAILSLGGPAAILPPRQPCCPPGSHVCPRSRRLPGSRSSQRRRRRRSGR